MGAQCQLARVEKKYFFCAVRSIQIVWLISQNECHQRVYLVDSDDFYFWICKKIFTRKKLRSPRKSVDQKNRDHVFFRITIFLHKPFTKKVLFFLHSCNFTYTNLSLGLVCHYRVTEIDRLSLLRNENRLFVTTAQ